MLKAKVSCAGCGRAMGTIKVKEIKDGELDLGDVKKLPVCNCRSDGWLVKLDIGKQ